MKNINTIFKGVARQYFSYIKNIPSVIYLYVLLIDKYYNLYLILNKCLILIIKSFIV